MELGANLNVHDIAGYTPLHHCLTCSGNEYTVKVGFSCKDTFILLWNLIRPGRLYHVICFFFFVFSRVLPSGGFYHIDNSLAISNNKHEYTREYT